MLRRDDLRRSLVFVPLLLVAAGYVARYLVPPVVLDVAARIAYWPPMSAGIEWVAFASLIAAGVLNRHITRRAETRETQLFISGRNGVNKKMAWQDITQADFRNLLIGVLLLQAVMLLILPNTIDARAMVVKLCVLGGGVVLARKSLHYWRSSIEINNDMDARAREGVQ